LITGTPEREFDIGKWKTPNQRTFHQQLLETRRIKMKRLTSILSASLLTLAMSSAALAGNITTRDGNITTRNGNITTRNGNITTRDGNITTMYGNITTLFTDIYVEVVLG
jgi:hypothetical protein